MTANHPVCFVHTPCCPKGKAACSHGHAVTQAIAGCAGEESAAADQQQAEIATEPQEPGPEKDPFADLF